MPKYKKYWEPTTILKDRLLFLFIRVKFDAANFRKEGLKARIRILAHSIRLWQPDSNTEFAS